MFACTDILTKYIHLTVFVIICIRMYMYVANNKSVLLTKYSDYIRINLKTTLA